MPILSGAILSWPQRPASSTFLHRPGASDTQGCPGLQCSTNQGCREAPGFIALTGSQPLQRADSRQPLLACPAPTVSCSSLTSLNTLTAPQEGSCWWGLRRLAFGCCRCWLPRFTLDTAEEEIVVAEHQYTKNSQTEKGACTGH